MIYIKSSREIEGIKKACAIWKKVKEVITKKVHIGMTTNELDKIALDVITQNNATPTFLNYGGFPKNICISINEELIHGIPSSRKIKNGDMITFDVGVTYMKYICDSAFTVILGINKEAQKINDATYECLIESIKEIKPDNVTGDISNKIENIAKTNHYEVIKDYSGHGCGIKLHEDPQISCFGDKHSGTKLKPGMILCIEPMLMTDSDEYYTESNNTVVARNHKLTCHWEHMVLVTETGYEILTQ